MQCNNCGHERPRSGKCPHCGAAATNASSSSHPSSLRGWRDQSSSSGSGRPSGTNWDDAPSPPTRAPNSRPVGNNDSRSQGRDAGWGAADASYTRRPGDSVPRRAGDSSGRRGDPGSSYARRDEYDDYGANDRALMPTPGAGGALMPQLDDRALPALPSEEEERALGIRRPAYIPATEVRKGERPSNIRVISGVASIMLLCVAMLGVSGFLVQHSLLPGFLTGLGISHLPNSSSVSNDIPPVYAAGKPLVTPVTPNKTPITKVLSYQSVTDPNNGGVVTPQSPSDLFLVNRYVYIVGDTNDQTKVGDKVSIKWYFSDQDVTADIQKSVPPGKPACCVVSFTGGGKPQQFKFALSAPVAAPGKAEIYYNNILADTVLFLVVDQFPTPTPVPTKTPLPNTPVPATPAATKHP